VNQKANEQGKTTNKIISWSSFLLAYYTNIGYRAGCQSNMEQLSEEFSGEFFHLLYLNTAPVFTVCIDIYAQQVNRFERFSPFYTPKCAKQALL